MIIYIYYLWLLIDTNKLISINNKKISITKNKNMNNDN